MNANLGVTQRVFAHPDGERWDVLAQSWHTFIASLGMQAVPIPNTTRDPARFIARFSLRGVLLTGGNDLAQYGGDAPERDALETRILDYAVRHRLPVLGVCRGMQVIQDYFGGDLDPVPGHAGVRHAIVHDGVRSEVNSYHAFGFRTTPASLDVCAIADDGVIEAIRHRSGHIHGIMWHPERNRPFDPRDLALFKRILRARP